MLASVLPVTPDTPQHSCVTASCWDHPNPIHRSRLRCIRLSRFLTIVPISSSNDFDVLVICVNKHLSILFVSNLFVKIHTPFPAM